MSASDARNRTATLNPQPPVYTTLEAPNPAILGTLWLHPVTGALKFWNGTDWVGVVGGGGGGGETLAETLALGNDANALQITNLADPTLAQDVATKAYVDAIVPGTQNLAQVLTEGNDANGIELVNLADPTADQSAATKVYVDSQPASNIETVLIAGESANGQRIVDLESVSAGWLHAVASQAGPPASDRVSIDWDTVLKYARIFCWGPDNATPGGFRIRLVSLDASVDLTALSIAPDGIATFLVSVTSPEYLVGGTKVVGAQEAAIADAAGGAVVDAEARTALNALLAACRSHGLIAT